MVLFLTYLAAHTTYIIQVQITNDGRIALLFLTFLFAWAVDTIKSFGLLSLIYLIVVRRFGYLKENEKDFMPEDPLDHEKKENNLPRLKNFCLKMLEHRVIETISLVIISIYTIFILFWLTMLETINVDENKLVAIDQVFLLIFAIEIMLKIFASNGMFIFTDLPNAFDATIVFVSLVLNFQGISAKGLGVLRLIRVVVITMRKILGNQSKLRH